MPPKPIKRLNAVANRPMIAISVRSWRKNGASTSGATASAAASAIHRAGRTLLLRVSEQPPRPHDQHDRHEGEQEHDRDRGKDQDAERLELADEERADEAAGEAPEATDHDDHEGRREH